MLRNLLIITYLLSCGIVSYSQNKPKEKALKSATAETKIDYKKIGAPLPPMKIFTKEGTYLSNKELSNEANLLVMLFNPTCDHCEQQTEILKRNLSLFNKSKLILVAAPGMGPYLSFFTTNTKIDSFKRFQVGLDSSQYIEKTFNYEYLPQINIYNRERKLIRTFNGSHPIDSLKKYIE